MTRAEADARALEHARTWALLATALTAWALARASTLALVYAALADVAGLRQLAADYRAPRAAPVVAVLALAASAARTRVVGLTAPVSGFVPLLAVLACHLALAATGALAMRLRARV